MGHTSQTLIVNASGTRKISGRVWKFAFDKEYIYIA